MEVQIISVTEGNAQIVSATFKLNKKGVVVAEYNNDMIKRDLANGISATEDDGSLKTFFPKDGKEYLKAIMRTYTGHRVRAVEV